MPAFASSLLRRPSDLAGLRRSLRSWLEAQGVDGLALDDSLVVAHEAALMALDGGEGPPTAEVQVTVAEGHVLITVTDTRRRAALVGKTLPAMPLKLIHAFSRDVELVTHAFGATMRMRVDLGRS